MVTFPGTGRPFAGAFDPPRLPPMDVEPILRLASATPGAALFPLHEAFEQLGKADPGNEEFLPSLSAVLADAEQAISGLQDILMAPVHPAAAQASPFGTAVGFGAAAEDPIPLCDWYRGDQERNTAELSLSVAAAGGILIRSAGDFLFGIGQTSVNLSVSWLVGSELDVNKPRQFGPWIKLVGVVVGDLVNEARGKLLSCDVEEIRALSNKMRTTQLKMRKGQRFIKCMLTSGEPAHAAKELCRKSGSQVRPWGSSPRPWAAPALRGRRRNEGGRAP